MREGHHIGRMSSLLGGLMAISLVLPVAMGTANAQNSQPSAKVTAKTANLILIPETNGTTGWQTLLYNTIKTSNSTSLYIGASFEVGLFTQTLSSSKNMTSDSSTATANVQVQVTVDGKVVEPGQVVFGRRTQTLTATLEGAIAGCLSIVTNPDGTQSIVLDPTCVAPETIELILDSMDAASFNFVALNVGVGVHTVCVQARIDTTGSAQTGSFKAMGTVGKGTMTVEAVRLIQDPNVIYSVN